MSNHSTGRFISCLLACNVANRCHYSKIHPEFICVCVFGRTHSCRWWQFLFIIIVFILFSCFFFSIVPIGFCTIWYPFYTSIDYWILFTWQRAKAISWNCWILKLSKIKKNVTLFCILSRAHQLIFLQWNKTTTMYRRIRIGWNKKQSMWSDRAKEKRWNWEKKTEEWNDLWYIELITMHIAQISPVISVERPNQQI